MNDIREPFFSCPFCHYICDSQVAIIDHVGFTQGSSKCRRKALWSETRPCAASGGAPTCQAPARFLDTGYHNPEKCLADYIKWERLRADNPFLPAYTAIWLPNRLYKGHYINAQQFCLVCMFDENEFDHHPHLPR